MMLYLAKDKLDVFFEKASEKRNVYVPVDDANGSSYQKWMPGTVVSGGLHTTRSAKDFFFPQTCWKSAASTARAKSTWPMTS